MWWEMRFQIYRLESENEELRKELQRTRADLEMLAQESVNICRAPSTPPKSVVSATSSAGTSSKFVSRLRTSSESTVISDTSRIQNTPTYSQTSASPRNIPSNTQMFRSAIKSH
eukprot:PhF_6_TR40858/c0_g1_i1/m.61824